jgi:hypothetical protein
MCAVKKAKFDSTAIKSLCNHESYEGVSIISGTSATICTAIAGNDAYTWKRAASKLMAVSRSNLSFGPDGSTSLGNCVWLFVYGSTEPYCTESLKLTCIKQITSNIAVK